MLKGPCPRASLNLRFSDNRQGTLGRLNSPGRPGLRCLLRFRLDKLTPVRVKGSSHDPRQLACGSCFGARMTAMGDAPSSIASIRTSSATRQKVRVVLSSQTTSLPIKLIEPSGPGSPFIWSPKMRRLHHLCFRCSSLENYISLLERKGRADWAAAAGRSLLWPIDSLHADRNINFEMN